MNKNLDLLACGSCQMKFFRRSPLFFFKKNCGHSGTICASGEDSDTHMQYLSICYFSITYTLFMTKKFRFNSNKYSTCDWEISIHISHTYEAITEITYIKLEETHHFENKGTTSFRGRKNKEGIQKMLKIREWTVIFSKSLSIKGDFKFVMVLIRDNVQKLLVELKE